MKSKNRKKRQPILNNQDILISKLRKNNIVLDDFLALLDSFKDTFFESSELEMELLISNGLPIDVIDNHVSLRTVTTPFKEQTFCIVDIETNGSNVSRGQVIEIGAIKLKNGEIIDEYESLVYAKDIPPYIQEVTKITPDMLKDAPPLKEVLEEFKIFLEDDIFVAHDIKFDYKFISESFKKYDLGQLENRKLCTIDLAKRTIKAKRYGLDFLKTLLDINIDNQHRAFSDALSTSYILKESFSQLPQTVQSAEDVIVFSKSDNIINNKEEEECFHKKNI